MRSIDADLSTLKTAVTPVFEGGLRNDTWIKQRCRHTSAPMIDPFVDRQVRGNGVISYGVTSFGYDIRCAPEGKLPVHRETIKITHTLVTENAVYVTNQQRTSVTPNNISAFRQADMLDPKCPESDLLKFEEMSWTHDDSGLWTCLPPNTFMLTRSLEYIRMPRDTQAYVWGKSTWARMGLLVNVTPLEAGWEGHITLELANLSPFPIKVYALEGIAQIAFISAEAPEVSYADKQGKYQGQTGVTLSRVENQGAEERQEPEACPSTGTPA